MKPKTYKAPKGNHCGGCKYVFKKVEWDEDSSFYCTKGDLEKRPCCGSVCMQECHPSQFRSAEYWRESYHLWESWAENREVEEFGCCDEFEGKEN
jgi:hypothetical protein